MFKRILMAFKFTHNCKAALAKAAQMAKDQNSELYVYHALNYRLATIDRNDPRIVEMVREANKKYEEDVRPHAGDMPIHTFECAPADPGLEICKVACRIGADLILMGSHNESEKPNLSRVNYVGMTILEKAPCPVMLIPA